jgi:hypothetical protein
MNRHLASKVMAAGVLGILVGSYIHYDYATWSRLGQQKFMAHQMIRFDQYIAVPQPVIRTMGGTTVLVLGFAGIYELVAALFHAILRRIWPDRGNQQTSEVQKAI